METGTAILTLQLTAGSFPKSQSSRESRASFASAAAFPRLWFAFVIFLNLFAPFAPCETHASEVSELEAIAQRLQPGELTELGGTLPSGFSSFQAFHNHGTGSEPDTWNTRAQWDPVHRRTYFFGDRNAIVFHSYIAQTHEWRHNAVAGSIPHDHHQYGGVAFDRHQQHFYRKSGGLLHLFIPASEHWKLITDDLPAGGTSPMEYHEGLRALLILGNHDLYQFDGSGWRTIAQVDNHGHHANMIYNRTRRELIIVGGNRSRRTVTLMDERGQKFRMADAPFDWRAQHHVLSYDPRSGNYLVLHRRERVLWEYSPAHDQWLIARQWPEPHDWPFGNFYGHVLIPVDEFGVIVWLHRSGPMVYRHKSVFPGDHSNSPLSGSTQATEVPNDFGKTPRVQSSDGRNNDETADRRARPSVEPLDPALNRLRQPATRAAELDSSRIRALREQSDFEGDQPQSQTAVIDLLDSSNVRAIREGRLTLADIPAPQPGTPDTDATTQPGALSSAFPAAPSVRPSMAHILRQHPAHAAFSAIGRSMKPGEWRYVETTNTPDFRVRFCGSGDASTHALGWTDAFAYDAQTQSFWAIGMREASEKRLFFLDRNLVWHEVSMPWGEDCTRDRRPFNRLTVADIGDGPHLYWPVSNGTPTSIGRMIRAPIAPYLAGETRIDWQQFSEGFGIRNMNSTGDFAVEWFPEIASWVFFGRHSGTRTPTPFSQEGHTPEGASLDKSWHGQAMVLSAEERVWRFFDRTYSGQYRARLIYNPFRKEVLLAPGSEFRAAPGSTIPQREWARIVAGGRPGMVTPLPDGQVPMVKKLDQATGDGFELPAYSPRYHSLGVNPVNGDYLWWNRHEEVIWSSPDGKRWYIYDDFNDLDSNRFPPERERFRGRRGLFGATGYVQMNALPGTDLVVFFDPDRGVILHRIRPNR